MFERSDLIWKSSKTRRRNFAIVALLILSVMGFYFLCYSSLRHPIPKLKSQNKSVIENMHSIESIGSGQVDILHMVISGVNLTTKIPASMSNKIETQKHQVTVDNAMPSERQKALESLMVKLISILQPPNIENTTKQNNLTDPIGKQTSFSKTMEEFDWKSYMTAVKNNDRTLLKTCLEKFILELSYFLALPPTVPINSECKAPPLAPPEQINCSDYLTGLTGVRNNKTAKIGVFLTFGFDVDVLEIHLNNMYDVVDKIFITESTKSHLMTLPKPLMWEQVKHQKRFIKFAPRLVHLIVDDAQNEDVMIKTNLNPKDIWLMQVLQEKLNWEKFLDWNKANSFFSGDDILGFGDADEIPSRKMLNVLKYCQLKGDFVDFGIWFPLGNINQAFKTDFPVKDHPFTLSCPKFRTFQSALHDYKSKGQQLSLRSHGGTPSYLLGGMHMTHYGYLPHQLVKRVTATEYSPFSIKEARKLSKISTSGDIRALERKYAAVPEEYRSRFVNLSSISEEMKDIAILPWFYDCNRDRYPVWEGRHDSRLD